MYLKLATLLCITLISPLTTRAQSNRIHVNSSNPQRTRVLDTKGPDAAPTKIVWKSEKLFERRPEAWTGLVPPSLLNFPSAMSDWHTKPVIANDLLYFSYNTDNGYLYAIKRETGEKLIVLKVDRNWVSLPAVKDNIVFFGSSGGQVHAYDVTKRGDKWTFEDKKTTFAQSDPTLDRELLYFYAAEKGLYSFVADTGAVKWFFKSEDFVRGPAVAGDRVILLTSMGRLIALDRATGAKVWDVGVGREAATPSVLGDQIFLVYDGGTICSYSAIDGHLQWKSKDVPRSGTLLALHRGLVYYGGQGHSVIALDATTGAEKLRFKTNRRCYSPLIAGDLLYVDCDDHRLYALSTSTLAEVWRLQEGKISPVEQVYADGAMYWLTRDGYLWAAR